MLQQMLKTTENDRYPSNTLRGSHKLGLRLSLKNLITFMQNSKQFINIKINGSIHRYTANQLIQGTSPGFPVSLEQICAG